MSPRLTSPKKTQLLKILRSQKLMTLAVCDSSPWVCTVFYYVDDNLNFYILTSPKTKHGQILAKNPKVALNIYDSGQNVTDRKTGVQIVGTAKPLRAIEKLKWGLKMWNATNPGKEAIINFNNIKNKVISGTIYTITPTKIQLFSEELYGDKEFETFEVTSK